jgi:hypothetical protein
VNEQAKGRVIVDEQRRVEPVKIDELTAALGTATAADTARIVPFFGPTLAGTDRFVEALGLDLSRALLVGHRWRWARPLQPGETLTARLHVDDIYTKGDNTFAVVVAELRDDTGDLVQQQWTTFIERGAQ